MTRDESEAGLETRLRALAADPAAPPPPLIDATLRRSRAELAALHGRGALFGELARLMAALAPSLVLAVVWNLAVLWLGGELLGRILPEALVRAIGTAYVFGAVGWTALVVGAAPALVHKKLARRYQETAS